MRSVGGSLLLALSIAVLALALRADAAEPAPESWVPVRIKRVLVIEDTPAVLLLDEPEQRYLLVFVDYFMAESIQIGLRGQPFERPLTHDLIGILLGQLDARVTRVSITGLKQNTYFAMISLVANGQSKEIDARPSDALAIAVRIKAPIRVAQGLLRPVGAPPPAQPPEDKPGPSASGPGQGST
ncbi:MAG: bifunctional nuclease family protein [Candidatus Lambdaproteobacteria bacterium]|nr:bifunctional nuclease family protein [Candidatus Lambdaproteobacteria bacterium]